MSSSDAAARGKFHLLSESRPVQRRHRRRYRRDSRELPLAIVWTLLLLAGLVPLSGCGGGGGGGSDAGPPPGPGSGCSSLHAELPPLPAVDASVVLVDAESLDRRLQQACEDRDDAQVGDQLELLLGDVPLSILDGAVLVEPRSVSAPELLGAMYASGYVGGLWLRAALLAGGPQPLLSAASHVPTDAELARLVAQAAAGIEASRANAADSLAHADRILDGLAESFGYNLGYLELTQEMPPRGASVPAELVTCSGALGCTYAAPRLPARATLDGVAQRLLAPPSATWRELAARIHSRQVAQVPLGRLVWTSQLSIAGLSPDSYALLLRLSAAFLEAVQTVALINAGAIAEVDFERARTGALTSALVRVWTGAYAIGLLDSRPELRAPAVVQRASAARGSVSGAGKR